MARFWNPSTETLVTLFLFELASLWMRGVLICGNEALHGVRPSVFSATSEHSYQRDAVGRGSSRSPSLQPNLWFTPYPVGLYSGNSSLKARGGLECMETGWGWGEESPEAT